MKKLYISLLTFFIIITLLPSNLIFAESACDEAPNSQECKIEQALEKSKNISKINDEIAQAENELESAKSLASKYYNEAEALNDDIDELQVQIEELKLSIEELTGRINENEAKKEELNNRVLNRMESSQATMHFNPMLDFILGSKGFSDMLRRTYGVEAIMSKESSDREELVRIIEQLTVDKTTLENNKSELDQKKDELVEKQAELRVKMNYYYKVMAEVKEKIAEYQNELEKQKSSYKSLLNEIDDLSSLPSESGFYSIFNPRVARYTGYFPRYDGNSGDIHLGVDYGAPYGTAIYAPSTALILASNNSCNGYGYLGCSCGGDSSTTGVSYGGNQIYMITSVNNQVYALTFSHLKQSDVTVGEIVSTGDKIGEVGSSGNSSGPHLHLEMFYLGKGDWEDIQKIYLQKDYSMSFNCGWGSYAYYNTTYKVKSTPPYRVDASDYIPITTR